MCPEQLIGYGRAARALIQFTVECINDVSNTDRPSGTGGFAGRRACVHSLTHSLPLSQGRMGWGGVTKPGKMGGRY